MSRARRARTVAAATATAASGHADPGGTGRQLAASPFVFSRGCSQLTVRRGRSRMRVCYPATCSTSRSAIMGSAVRWNRPLPSGNRELVALVTSIVKVASLDRERGFCALDRLRRFCPLDWIDRFGVFGQFDRLGRFGSLGTLVRLEAIGSVRSLVRQHPGETEGTWATPSGRDRAARARPGADHEALKRLPSRRPFI